MPQAVVDGKIYVIGTFVDPQTYAGETQTRIYDPANDNWSLGTPAPLNIFLGYAAATSGAFAPSEYMFSEQTEASKCNPKHLATFKFTTLKKKHGL
jgi:hypothetical protein